MKNIFKIMSLLLVMALLALAVVACTTPADDDDDDDDTTVTLGTELISNGDFEDTTTDWDATSAMVITPDVTDTSDNVLVVTHATTQTNGYDFGLYQPDVTGLETGETYTVSLKVKANAAITTGFVIGFGLGVDPYTDYYNSGDIAVTTDWVTITKTFTITATAATADNQMYIYFGTIAAPAVIYLNDISLKKHL